MLTGIKHNIIRISVKFAALLTAGLIGGALITSGAWAANPTPIKNECTGAGASKFDTDNVIMFVVDQTGHTNVYYGAEPTSKGPWSSKTVNLNNSLGISVSIANPTYCYKVSGNKVCITY